MSAVAEAKWPLAGAYERVGSWLRKHRAIAVVLGLGLLVRAVLMPLTYGGDFGMWSLTAAAALHGQDTYSNPPLPIQQAGPYAYFPLYLYLLLPLKWLALHTSLPYVILGKLPVLVGDLGVTLALAAMLRRAGLGERACAIGAALFFLNPMVLYNGAFYGRFDSLCLAALLLAWHYLERPVRPGWPLALWYALGVTLKTFPIFLLPYLLRRTGLRRGLGTAVAALALPLLVSLPYLLHNAGRFLYIVFIYDSTKGPRQFSWQLALLDMGLKEGIATIISYGLLALFVLALLAPLTPLLPLSRLWERPAGPYGEGNEGVPDPYAYAAVAFTLFLLLSKVVYEQYFLWPLPFLIVLVMRNRSRAAGALLAVLSVTGLLANGWIHPFGYQPGPALWLNALIALVAVAFVFGSWRGRLVAATE